MYCTVQKKASRACERLKHALDMLFPELMCGWLLMAFKEMFRAIEGGRAHN